MGNRCRVRVITGLSFRHILVVGGENHSDLEAVRRFVEPLSRGLPSSSLTCGMVRFGSAGRVSVTFWENGESRTHRIETYCPREEVEAIMKCSPRSRTIVVFMCNEAVQQLHLLADIGAKWTASFEAGDKPMATLHKVFATYAFLRSDIGYFTPTKIRRRRSGATFAPVHDETQDNDIMVEGFLPA